MSDDAILLPYLFEPLDFQKKQIRILILHPSIDRKARVEGHFVHCDLAEAPTYAALSYVWGERRHGGSIILEGSKLTIPTNLQQLLLRLRHSHSKRTLWADAICINQDDIQERNNQVSYMAQIYRKATMVIVWLGELDERSQDIPQFLETINTAVAKGVTLKNSELSTLYSSMETLLSRPWFQRIWTMQEVCLASNVSILLGSQDLSWNALETSFMLYKEMIVYAEQEGDTNTSPDSKAAVRFASALFEGRAQLERGRSTIERSLHSLILAHGTQSATDLRDKIYGVLALASDRDTGYAKLSVDYHPNHSPELLFEDFYQQCVRAKQSLDVLLWPWPRNIPSPPWVHSPNDSTCAEPLVQPIGLPGHKPLVPQSNPFFGDTAMLITVDGAIEFGGILIDRVEAVSDIHSIVQYEGLPIPRSWIDLAKIDMLVAMLMQGYDHTTITYSIYEDLVKFLTRVYGQDGVTVDNTPLQLPDVPKKYDRVLRWMYNLTRGRRLFKTTKWGDVGLAPVGVRKGDG
jgi:hypothetical protein